MRRLRASLVTAVLAAATVLFLGACDALVGDFTISLEPSEVIAEQGSEFEVVVKVSHAMSFSATPFPILVRLYDSPDYVTAKDIEIPGDMTEGVMTVVVAADASIGETEKILVVRATNTIVVKEAFFTLAIVEAQ